jgi:hypothetical protein
MAVDDDNDDDTDCFDGLNDLFTVKQYQPIVVEIPRFFSMDGSDEHSLPKLSIELWHSPAACTDPDLTGQILWPVSRLLSYYLANNASYFGTTRSAQTSFHNNRCRSQGLRPTFVLELGAGGTALPSLTAFLCASAAASAGAGAAAATHHSSASTSCCGE